ncbi:MAG: hypothetical protein ACREOI_28370 [bacterium]
MDKDMREIVGQLLGWTWFLSLVAASVYSLKIEFHIQPRATLISPIKAWKNRRECMRKYKRNLLDDPKLESLIKKYTLYWRVSYISLILFLLGATINSFIAAIATSILAVTV